MWTTCEARFCEGARYPLPPRTTQLHFFHSKFDLPLLLLTLLFACFRLQKRDSTFYTSFCCETLLSGGVFSERANKYDCYCSHAGAGFDGRFDHMKRNFAFVAKGIFAKLNVTVVIRFHQLPFGSEE